MLWRIKRLAGSGLEARVVVVLIGTNNLSVGMTPEDTVAGIVAVVEAAQNLLPLAKIFLVPLLPRGDGRAPQSAVAKTNALLRESALVAGNKDTKVTWAEGCGSQLIRKELRGRPEDEWQVDASLMPDRLQHPGVAGTRAWLACVQRAVTARDGQSGGQ